ncbi:MAG: FkbM family methyltransferase, partial [Ruminococcus sp.]|nr:FkbM family methyltransferase [Ruminococcus sp.]
ILDLGAYNGDTAQELASACKGYSRLIAVEPEKKNFQKLIRNTAALDSIEYINAAAWSHECELSFCSSAGRMAAVGDGGKTVRAVSVDGLLGGGRCDLIKYDVEGADKEAILGSKDTIERWCPKICTAVYHRPYDYFELINLIGGIRPDYSFRLTQDVYYPAWETNITAYI